MKPKPIIFIALGHFIVSRTLFVWVFGREMAQFDTGQPPNALDRLAGGISTVLDLPVALLLTHVPPTWLPGLVGYIPFVANSLVWGLLAWFIYSRIINAKVEKNA